MRKEFLLAISIILVSIIFYPNNSAISSSTGSGGGGGNTNSPIDGQSCTDCHIGAVNSVSDSNQFSYNIMPVVFDPISSQWDGVYTPGVTYTLSYSIKDNSATLNKYGFEVTAEADAANQKTGTFFITN